MFSQPLGASHAVMHGAPGGASQPPPSSIGRGVSLGWRASSLVQPAAAAHVGPARVASPTPGPAAQSTLDAFLASGANEAPGVAALHSATDVMLACISPTHSAAAQRSAVYAYVAGLVRQFLGADALLTGSYATHTYLPDSDIDITVMVPRSTLRSSSDAGAAEAARLPAGSGMGGSSSGGSGSGRGSSSGRSGGLGSSSSGASSAASSQQTGSPDVPGQARAGHPSATGGGAGDDADDGAGSDDGDASETEALMKLNEALCREALSAVGSSSSGRGNPKGPVGGGGGHAVGPAAPPPGPSAACTVRNVSLVSSGVKLLTCTVNNLVVDVSCRGAAAVASAAFLEEMDRVVGQGHLFKRSLVLLKGNGCGFFGLRRGA
jgi:hypothetical protein